MAPITPVVTNVQGAGTPDAVFRAIDAKFREVVQREYMNLGMKLQDRIITYAEGSPAPDYGSNEMTILIGGDNYSLGSPGDIDALVLAINALDIGICYINDSGKIVLLTYQICGSITQDASAIFTVDTITVGTNFPTQTDINRELALRLRDASAAAAGVAQPDTQIVMGSGTGITSDQRFTFNPATGRLDFKDSDGNIQMNIYPDISNAVFGFYNKDTFSYATMTMTSNQITIELQNNDLFPISPAASIRLFADSTFSPTAEVRMQVQDASGNISQFNVRTDATYLTNALPFRFQEKTTNGLNYVGLKVADSLAVSTEYELPSAYPASSGYILSATTGGVMSWIAASTGSVTSFSAGNLSPLFTTSVATATTTPALTFSLTAQIANKVFAGPTTGANAAPTFRSLVAADLPATVVYSDGSYSNPAWITALAWAKITGTPTTISGYGITDAYTIAQVDSAISSATVGLLDDRGNFDASANLFPSSGGSGAAGAILKGDLWTISVAGTLGGHTVTVGDVVRALSDTPGQTDANWAIGENNFGYVAVNAGGSYANPSFITSLLWSKITSTPTTLAGYGITDLIALTSGTLAQFAATTSSQLAGVISDETGSGALVFANTPTLVTPVLGAATATTINKYTFTTPANNATLTIDDGFTLHATGNVTALSGSHTGASSGTNTGDQTIALTGDVTGSGTGSFAATIAADAVTYAKMQNISATQRLLGRNTAAAGDTEEVTLTQLLDWISGSVAQGDILYRDSGGWARLGAGTSGQYLKTLGTGANPLWATVAAGSGTVTNVATGNGLTGGAITTTGTIDLLLNASGGLSKVLGAGTNELGIAALGVTNAMLAGSIGNTKLASQYLYIDGTIDMSGSLTAATGLDLGSTSKQWRFLYLYGAGTYSTTYLKLTGTPTSTRTVTFPDASITVAGKDFAQTWTAAQTYTTALLKVADIADANGNLSLAATATASAVDYFTFINAATANPATIKMTATGSDSNVNLLISPKGTGKFQFTDGTDATKIFSWDLSPMTTGVTLTINNDNAANRTLTIPTMTGNRALAFRDQANTFSAAQTYTNQVIISLTGTSAFMTGTSSTIYRDPNSGGNSNSHAVIDPSGSTTTAGAKAYFFDDTSGFMFTAANGTRRVARASIVLGSMVNTADAETGDLLFKTKFGTNAIAETFRISSQSANLQVSGGGTMATWTTLGSQLKLAAATYTDSGTAGTRATGVSVGIAQPTFAGTNAVTITDAATLYISDAPAAGTNMTLTNKYSLWVAAGNVKLGALDFILDATTGTKWGTAVSQKQGFWNATPVVQPSSANQAAVVTTAATNVTPYGFTQAQADSIVTLLNQIRSDLVTMGLIKGSV